MGRGPVGLGDSPQNCLDGFDSRLPLEIFSYRPMVRAPGLYPGYPGSSPGRRTLYKIHIDDNKKFYYMQSLEDLKRQHEHEITMLKLQCEIEEKKLKMEHELKMLKLRGGWLGRIFGCQ